MTDYFVLLAPFGIWLLVSVMPSIRLLDRLRLNRWLAALNVVPLVGTVIMIWIVAYSHWPRGSRSLAHADRY